MATLVRFLVHEVDGDVLAMFPQINYCKQLYGTKQKMSYMRIGQHGACASDIHIPASDNPWISATLEQYADLLQELKNVGYDNLKIIA